MRAVKDEEAMAMLFVFVFILMVIGFVARACYVLFDTRGTAGRAVSKLKNLKSEREQLVKKYPDMVAEIDQIVVIKRVRILEKEDL